MNIVLLGFMGTGKTSVGNIVAKKLKMTFISTDDLIEEREKRPIKEIFNKESEAYFRQVEKDVVREVSCKDNFVIATGGGVVLDEDNMKNLGRNGLLILLEAREDIILKRIKNNGERPLLSVEDQIGEIKELLKKRKPLYDKVPHRIDTSDKALEEVSGEVLKICSKKIKK